MRVINGIDVLLKEPKKYLGSDMVGLITNPTGVTMGLDSTLDAFYEHPDIKITMVPAHITIVRPGTSGNDVSAIVGLLNRMPLFVIGSS